MTVFKWAILILSSHVLSACDSPSVAFIGSTKTIVVIENTTFSVRRRHDKVEVYRTSFEMLPPRDQVLFLAELAIEQATGCDVKNGSLKGDQALIKASLACYGQIEIPSIPVHQRYDCTLIEGVDVTTRAVITDAIDCVLVAI